MSQARAAQESLASLEKFNAPITQQIEQAALFAGISLSTLKSSSRVAGDGRIPTGVTMVGRSQHGRREWSLRWLMKKLQEEARRWPEAWRLLRWLVQGVPVRSVAKVLNERKFGAIVREVLEEAVARRRQLSIAVAAPTPEIMSDSIETVPSSLVKEKNRKSRKRRRDCEMVEVDDGSAERDVELIWAVYEAVDCVVHCSKSEVMDKEERKDEKFAAEYMKAVIRTTNDEAAKILGAWLELCIASGIASVTESWLLPFVEVWSSRIVGANDTMVFANHCLRPALLLLSKGERFLVWKSMLEQLLARNFIIPAKAAYASSMNMDLLSILAGEPISREPLFAPVLFNIAIRSLQPHGTRRRPQQDNTLLQATFATFYSAIGTSSSANKSPAIRQMLQCCLDHQVTLDLSILREITASYAISKLENDWTMLAILIKLDSNVFLMSKDSESVLKGLLNRITLASIETPWPDNVSEVVDYVLVPLMGEFAKARDLLCFTHFWYEQLVLFQDYVQQYSRAAQHFSAWEDEALQLKMRDIMEASMTTQQIVEAFEWVRGKIDDCPCAAFAVLDAISGAVTRDETIHAVILGYWNIIEANEDYFWQTKRFCHRLWRIANRFLQWQSTNNDNRTSDKWAGIRENFCESLGKDSAPNILRKEQLRYWCRWWTVFGDSCELDSRVKLSSMLECAIENDIVSNLVKVEEGLKTDLSTLGCERWGERTTRIDSEIGWSACLLVNMVLVEYPKVLELACKEQNPAGRELFQNIIWLASATTPSTSVHCKVPWLRINHDVFPNIWIKLLQDDSVLSNPRLMSHVINAMLDCASHIHNPIEKSRACNGFVINCLHRLPLEVFSKSNREFIVKAWQPESPDPARNDIEALSYKMATIDPAVLSLKAKMMQRPTLYKGIKFRDLVDLAEHLVLLSPKPKVVLPIFAELARLTLGHVVATMDQPRSRDYILEVVSTLEDWLQNNSKAKVTPQYAMVRLAQVAVLALNAKFTSLEALGNLSKQREAAILALFKNLLLSNLQRRLQKPEKLKNNNGDRCMSLHSTMDALDALGIDEIDLADVQVAIQQSLISLREFNAELEKRLETFMVERYPNGSDVSPSSLLRGDIASSFGRMSIQKNVQAMMGRMTEVEKLRLVDSLLSEGLADLNGLDKLLALRHVITSCEDSRDVPMSDDGPATMPLSSAYYALVSQLCKASSVRRFCLICEAMELILRTKSRAVTQYNIDTTLSSITILCSRQSPSLSSSRAGTIYSHLSRLLHTVITNHRVKLQGHFHLLLQTLQALLHCLFIPIYFPNTNSPSASSSTSKSAPFPPWLYSSTRRITPAHASAFTKLVTLICNPSPTAASQATSAAQPSSLLPLTSASKAAQRLAAQHMPLLLAAHVRWTLDLRLRLPPDVKEVLTPGWWAVLDTMTLEGRILLGEMMDSSGRAVLQGVVAEWSKWGRWKGN